MLLLLMRHGIAQPLGENALDDFGRPLTPQGRARTRRAAVGLSTLVPHLDLVASSPKNRARATAQIVSDEFGQRAPAVTEWPELMGDDLTALFAQIKKTKVKTALLCGHEPHLSALASQLLTGSPHDLALDFKKAGVMALEVDFSASRAVLLWHLAPKQLRQIGR